MSLPDLANGKTDDLFYPGSYRAEVQLRIRKPEERAVLRSRLAELQTIPREQWTNHDVIDLSPNRPGTYAVFFGEDGIAWVIPEADGRFQITGLGSQEVLDSFRHEPEEAEDDQGADE
jgi:hypothetical protein